jgi:hypothetical protein
MKRMLKLEGLNSEGHPTTVVRHPCAPSSHTACGRAVDLISDHIIYYHCCFFSFICLLAVVIAVHWHCVSPSLVTLWVVPYPLPLLFL